MDHRHLSELITAEGLTVHWKKIKVLEVHTSTPQKCSVAKNGMVQLSGISLEAGTSKRSTKNIQPTDHS